MTPPLEAVLFDLDGTLLDTAPDFIAVLRALMTEHQIESGLSDLQIRSHVSHGSGALVSLGFDIDTGDQRFEPLREQFLELYAARLSESTRLFPGIEALLVNIEQQNIPWGIITNKPERYATPLLDDLNLLARTHTLICPEHVSNAKPDPESLLLACSQINCNPRNAVYIGDHRRDIEAGNRAEMETIAVLYGYIDSNDPPHTWGADTSVEDVAALTDWIGQRIAT
ncbi:MAG: HAD-IA family hydrolase [Pseudomonadales bacterium]|nr:HAD-IA family hydrolase [Pseudomonadales bacterium]